MSLHGQFEKIFKAIKCSRMHFKYANIEKTFSIPLSERIVISHLMVFKTFLQVDHNVFLKIMTCKSPIKVQYLETVIKCVEHSFFTNRKVLTYIQDFENLKVFMSYGIIWWKKFELKCVPRLTKKRIQRGLNGFLSQN